MTQSFQPILTLAGRAADQASKIAGGAPVRFAAIVLGDGNGAAVSPVETQASLVNQIAALPVTRVYANPADATQIMVEAMWLPATPRGFTIREIGVVLDSGTLYAVGAYPDSFMPLPSQGVARGGTITVAFVETLASGNVVLFNNPGAFATEAWVGAYYETIADAAVKDAATRTALQLYDTILDVNAKIAAIPPPVAPDLSPYETIVDATAKDQAIRRLIQLYDTITDVDAKIAALQFDMLKVGEITFHSSSTPPAGRLAADGSLVSRDAYSRLWAYAQASGVLWSGAVWNNVGRSGFSTGDGATTFGLPDLRGLFISAVNAAPGGVIGNIVQPGTVSVTTAFVGDNSSSGQHIDVPGVPPKNAPLLACIKY